MSEVQVEARINVDLSDDVKESGASISLSRVRDRGLISLTVCGRFGLGSVDVDPSKLRDALDELISEDLGA